MIRPLLFLSISMLMLSGCKKDEPIQFYPKTFKQSQISHSYEFKVHDKTITPPPPVDSFYDSEYLNGALGELSFTLLNKDTLQLNVPGRSIEYPYLLRNDTLFIDRYIPGIYNDFDDHTLQRIPFAYGNQSQFRMIETHFSSTPVSLQNTLHNWPFQVKNEVSYQDYSYFTDTAALLTITRILK